jgi:hypothetical protein
MAKALWRVAVCALAAAFIQVTLAHTDFVAKRRHVPAAVER